MATLKPERTLTFPTDSPCVAGHFPGNPVVPAVSILSALIPWVETQLGRRVAGVKSARFRRPLVPGVSWDVTLEAPDGNEATLIGRDQGRVAVKARLILGRG